MDEVSKYVPNRLTLWCPICGADAGGECKTAHGGLRFHGHDQHTGARLQTVQFPPRWQKRAPAHFSIK